MNGGIGHLVMSGPLILARTAPAAPDGPASRGRAVAGTALFVLGFSVLFASYGAVFGGLGELLLAHQRGSFRCLAR